MENETTGLSLPPGHGIFEGLESAPLSRNPRAGATLVGHLMHEVGSWTLLSFVKHFTGSHSSRLRFGSPTEGRCRFVTPISLPLEGAELFSSRRTTAR